MKGWYKNHQGNRRTKEHTLEKLKKLELLHEVRDLIDEECLQWQQCQLILNQIYVEEKLYWKERSKQKWLIEGDLNTR